MVRGKKLIKIVLYDQNEEDSPRVNTARASLIRDLNKIMH